MARDENNESSTSRIFERYPANGEWIHADQKNPAIRLYGRRLYKDQTPVEYLAEFLLVFSSPKRDTGGDQYASTFVVPDEPRPRYYPEDRVALKLFSFFPSSKLETRHPAHRKEYLAALQKLADSIKGTEDQKDEAVRLLQSLFAGFVGVAKDRTWVTYSFLPASRTLLAREVNWLHTKAKRTQAGAIHDWKSSLDYFDDSLANFMSRGGELLFLQLSNLFASPAVQGLKDLQPQETYGHIGNDLPKLQRDLESGLKSILNGSLGQVDELANFVGAALSDYHLNKGVHESYLAWVPMATRTEALLFAWEMQNICNSRLGPLDRLELLQVLCCMQVLRTLCFQARRLDDAETQTPGFAGNYAWIVSDPEAPSGEALRQMAQHSFKRIDELLFRVIRNPALRADADTTPDYKNADENTYKFFRKMAKEIGFVVPRTGSGQRFVLDQGLVRFFVSALVPPRTRIRLNEFYRRLFAHYGIALGGEAMAVASGWTSKAAGKDFYAQSSGTRWIEETLKQGGFLVELSDAVSIVVNDAGEGESA